MPEPTIEQKLVDYVTMTAAAMEKVAAYAVATEARDAAVARLIPQAVAAMVDNQRIQPGQAEKLAAILRDPVQALEVLVKTAAHRNDAEIAEDHARLGRPSGGGAVKAAAARQTFVGQRTGDYKPSDLKFLADFGLASPQA